MPNDECYQIDDLETVLTLPEGDQRLAHLERCPRCRGLVASYRIFMNGALPAGADAEDAERRIHDFLAREIGLSPPAAASAIRARTTASPEARAGIGARLSEALRARPLTWAAAAAAGVLVFVGVEQAVHLSTRLDDARRAPSVLRGGGPSAESGAMPAECAAASDGSFAFTWRAVEGADSYRIVLYDVEMKEVRRIDAGNGTSFVLGPGLLEAQSGAKRAAFWMIVALGGGDEIGRSKMRGLGSQ